MFRRVQCVCHFSASRGGDSGVGDGLRSGARTRLRDHSGEEGEARGEAAADRRGGPTLHGAHEEPVGDHRLDRCLESGVRVL